MIKLFEPSQINAALKNVTRSITVTRQRVQALAEQAVAYSIIHGDISVGNKLLEAVSINKSIRKDSLVAYFEKYGNFCWVKADKKLAFYAAHEVGTVTPEQEALIVGSKWDEAKREAEVVSQYDMEAEVRRFLTKMHKIVGDAANKVANPEALAVVEQTFNRWSAEATLKTMKVDQSVLDTTAAQQAVADAKAAQVEAVIPAPSLVIAA